MASSGLVPEEVKALMGQTVKVHGDTAPTKTLYGSDVQTGSGREVQCMIQPVQSKSKSSTDENTTGTHTIYADDVDITTEHVIELPNGDKQSVLSVETYNDGTNDWYQVVTC